jgi:hypothetical protein
MTMTDLFVQSALLLSSLLSGRAAAAVRHQENRHV